MVGVKLALEVAYRTWPILLATCLYLSQAVLYFRDRNPGMAVAFLGYAFANIGLVWASVVTGENIA